MFIRLFQRNSQKAEIMTHSAHILRLRDGYEYKSLLAIKLAGI
jgi:hypothetical protein